GDSAGDSPLRATDNRCQAEPIRATGTTAQQQATKVHLPVSHAAAMGNDYSRIQRRAFPQSAFVVAFRQPDHLLVLNAEPALLQQLRQAVSANWRGGVRSEKKYPLGVELRLDKEPFDSEVHPADRLVPIYRLVTALLKLLLDRGCTLLASGAVVRGVERSAWLLRKASDLCPARDVELLTVAMEDWGKLLLINSPAALSTALMAKLKEVWPKGVELVSEEPTYFAMELGEQPWDSYKSASERSPLIVLEVTRLLLAHGYSFLAATHARGSMDCLTFVKSTFPASDCQDEQPAVDDGLFVLSLNQRDQLRLYAAPQEVRECVEKFAATSWESGVLRSEASAGDLLQSVQLKSSPWFVPDWDKDAAFCAREFIQELLRELRSKGWQIAVKADIYRSAYDKSLLVLRRNSAQQSLPHLSVTTHDVNRLCVLGATESLKAELVNDVKDAWSRGHRCEAFESASGWTVEFSFDRKPWQWDPEAPLTNLEGFGLVATLIDVLQQRGWHVETSLDICSSSKFSPSTIILSLELPDARPLQVTQGSTMQQN
ncbi:hypothetical protein BOX15_Mlig031497g1, partial [Macrostomum lignano]